MILATLLAQAGGATPLPISGVPGGAGSPGGVAAAVAGPGTASYVMLATVVFLIGSLGFLVRRNTVTMFMCVELMLNAVNIVLVAFGRQMADIEGQIFVFFVMVVAAAEVMVGLAILVTIFRRRVTASIDDLNKLSG